MSSLFYYVHTHAGPYAMIVRRYNSCCRGNKIFSLSTGSVDARHSSLKLSEESIEEKKLIKIPELLSFFIKHTALSGDAVRKIGDLPKLDGVFMCFKDHTRHGYNARVRDKFEIY